MAALKQRYETKLSAKGDKVQRIDWHFLIHASSPRLRKGNRPIRLPAVCERVELG